MPLTMKIQPVDSYSPDELPKMEPVKQPVVKSRLKRLFERQFLRSSSAEKVGAVVEESQPNGGELEPSSLCLANMVQSFIEDNNSSSDRQQPVKCGRSCFNRNCDDSSEDEFEYFGSASESNRTSSGEACEVLKSLVPCSSVVERNLLADIAKIVDKNKINKRNDEFCRKIVTDGLNALGLNASICKSRWEKSSSHPAGDYEYIDVIIQGNERLLIDIDFRSQFEIARSTRAYKSILQTLPHIFVGKSDRLQKIIVIVSEAAKQSLRKKGMHIPPWRKTEYVKAKWLSPYTRSTKSLVTHDGPNPQLPANKLLVQDGSCKLEMNIVKQISEAAEPAESVVAESCLPEEKATTMVVTKWNTPESQPKSFQMGAKVIVIYLCLVLTAFVKIQNREFALLATEAKVKWEQMLVGKSRDAATRDLIDSLFGSFGKKQMGKEVGSTRGNLGNETSSSLKRKEIDALRAMLC
ncbi:hypothetical protein LINGRAHAP2_LOCUS19596 [Linum grandiflorum]